MVSFKLDNRQVVSLITIAALLYVVIAPALTFAAQLTERSIALTSASVDATDVTYDTHFTADGNAGAFVINFCSNTPLIGEPCDVPPDFNASGATSTTTGFTDVSALDANTLVVAGTITADDEVAVALDGIDNPSVAGPIYARIVTYDSDTHADSYDPENLGTGNVDEGSIAVSITPTIGVSGSVLESMTFCVSAAAITADCGTTTPPVLKLGETVGDVVALVSSEVSDGSIYTQMSTNAVNGAVVRLRSNTVDCGGLRRAGAPTACNISPALQTGIAAGEAKFGVKTATATNTGSNPVGTLQPVSGSGYNNSTYALNYVAGNATGVTSEFGDPFLDTNNAPANNKNMQLTFGASVSNSTPAGQYSADINLIATGKF